MIFDADPGLIAALVGFGLLSTLIDVSSSGRCCARPFPRRHTGRVGEHERGSHELRPDTARHDTSCHLPRAVDGVPLVTIVAWFVSIMVTTVACIGSVVLAILMSGGEVLPFTLLCGLFILLSGLALWLGANTGFVQKIARGRERMLGDRGVGSGTRGQVDGARQQHREDGVRGGDLALTSASRTSSSSRPRH